MKKNRVVKWLMAGGLSSVILFSLVACTGESIDGKWTSKTVAEEMYAEVVPAGEEDQFVFSDHSLGEILTKSEVNLNIKDDKATFEVLLFVDEEAFVTALKDEQLAAVRQTFSEEGLNYDELPADQKAAVDEQLLSEEQIRTFAKEGIDEIAKGMDGQYHAEKGYISSTHFKADVDRSARAFEITEITSEHGKDMVEKGESYVYSYKDGKLTLEGEKDEDDMVFEKK